MVEDIDILDFIERLFAWTVNHFEVFKDVAPEWPAPSSPPHIDPFVDGENTFLRLLVASLTSNELDPRDAVQVFATNGDCIVDNMAVDIRADTVRLLREEEYESLSHLNKVVLQVLNRTIHRNGGNVFGDVW